jgi:exodeoxyribonuclease VII small subunit
MSPRPKTKAPVEDLSFEQAFDEMEQIVRQLEEGQLSLDDSLALFERGQALSARCQQLLETAELKVQQLAPKASGGYSLQPFEDDDR